MIPFEPQGDIYTLWQVHPAKTQISLRVRCSVFIVRLKHLVYLAIHKVPIEDADEAKQM